MNNVNEIDRKHIWHPFTQHSDYEVYNHPVIVKGKNQFLFDDKGNRYYDTIASWWTSTIGHCNPHINAGIRKQLTLLDHVNFSGFTHPYAVELIKLLIPLFPKELSRFFFSDNGSTAVEAALKIAFQYYKNKGETEKNSFIKINNAYHGDTLGAASVGGIDNIHGTFNDLQIKTISVDAPICSSCPNRKSEFTFDGANTGCEVQCFKSMDETLNKHHRKICAVIIEPLLQAAGGMSVYPSLYLKKLRELTMKLDVILIFDEVATGFGRTGDFFAMDKAHVVPDIVTVSKGLTGGYLPLALTVCKDFIYRAFYADAKEGKAFLHGHSYTANPICCAAAISNIKEMIRLKLPYSKNDVISYFNDQVRDFSRFDFVNDIRFLGFTGAIDIVKSKNNFYSPDKRVGFLIYKKSLENGLILRALGDTIYWFLPFGMRKKDIKIIMEKTAKCITEVLKNV